MPNSCVVVGCYQPRSASYRPSLFKFPSNENLRSKWIKFVQRKRAEWSGPSSYSRVCELHFEQSCFVQSLHADFGFKRSRILKDNAIPTITFATNKEMVVRPAVAKRERKLIVEQLLTKKYVEDSMKAVEVIIIEELIYNETCSALKFIQNEQENLSVEDTAKVVEMIIIEELIYNEACSALKFIPKDEQENLFVEDIAKAVEIIIIEELIYNEICSAVKSCSLLPSSNQQFITVLQPTIFLVMQPTLFFIPQPTTLHRPAADNSSPSCSRQQENLFVEDTTKAIEIIIIEELINDVFDNVIEDAVSAGTLLEKVTEETYCNFDRYVNVYQNTRNFGCQTSLPAKHKRKASVAVQCIENTVDIGVQCG